MTDEQATPADDRVTLGRISGLYGVQGWVRVHSYTEPREGILDYTAWWLRSESGIAEATLEEGRRQGKAVIARLAGVTDRDTAAALIGCDIEVSRERLPPAGEGRYYWRDLEGLKVMHRDGSELGTVAYMMETGANDVMVTAGEVERLIPFVADAVVLDVDLDHGVITVDWEWD